jgi:hypothetical protein
MSRARTPGSVSRDFGEGSSVSRFVVAEWANLSARKTRCAYVAVTGTPRKPVHVKIAGPAPKTLKNCKSTE